MISKRLAILMGLILCMSQWDIQRIDQANQQSLQKRDAAIQKLQTTLQKEQQTIQTEQLTIQAEQKAIQDLKKKQAILSSRSGGPTLPGWNPGNWGDFMATWYTSQQGWSTGTITRTGAPVREGWTIAVDPNIIPLNSIVEVRFRDGSTHEYKATDTGGAIIGHRVDIYVNSTSEIPTDGREAVEIRVLAKG